MISILLSQRKRCSLEQFRNIYEVQAITEWQVAYIGFQALTNRLEFINHCFECYHHRIFQGHRHCIKILPLEEEVRQSLETALQQIDQLLESGINKAKKFAKWKLTEVVYYWSVVIEITVGNQLLKDITHDTYDKKRYLKQLIQLVYANTLCLKEFIELNKSIRKHCEEVKRDLAQPLLGIFDEHSQQHTDLIETESLKSVKGSEADHFRDNSFRQQQKLKHCDMEKYIRYLNAIQKEATGLFYSPIYYSEGSQEEVNSFARLVPNKKMSGSSYFLFGLYVGLGLVILIMLILLLILNFLQLGKDESINSITYVFPMFRGVGLLILYLWGIGWNVYGFIKYKINFKLVLKYGQHYSTPFQIMKRAGFFTLIFCFMLFLYLVGNQAQRATGINLPTQYTPFVVWIIYFAYIFFPSQQIFNPKGRIYFYGILKSILLSPFVKMGFVLSFATDQAVSFVTSIKDFAYSVCYYGSNFTVEEISSCLRPDSLDGIIVGYIAALIPLVFRLIQCWKAAKQNSGKFLGDLQMWNFFKYLSSILTSTLSFLNSLYPILFIPFVVSSIWSTLYSYYWDLKNDWGLLEKGSKHFLLRKKLCYNNPTLYYIAIVINLVFRCSWTLTISPSVLLLIPKSTFLPFLTGFIEIMRRCMWNFFRIEKQHVANCKQFTIAKQNPDRLVTKIKSQNLTRQFLADNKQTVIEYIKVVDQEYINHLKESVCKGLPKVEREQIQKLQQDFEEELVYEQKIAQTNHSLRRSGIKRDYFDI